MFPARTIRAQVLSLREQPYVHMARLAGLSDIRIIFEEIMPNILPLGSRQLRRRDIGRNPRWHWP